MTEPKGLSTFERYLLAVAVAISLFGLKSGAALVFAVHFPGKGGSVSLKRALLGILAAGLAFSAGAAEVELHYFWSATCPDCQIMWEFLKGLEEQYPELEIVAHEVTFDPEGWRLMVTLAREFGLEEVTTPTVIVGDLAISGVGRAVELRIREEVERCLAEGCPSPMARLSEKQAFGLAPLELLALLALGILIVLYLAG